MSKTLDSKTFNIFSLEKDVVVMTDLTSNSGQLSYKRTAPKRQKDFPGMEKGEVKHTLVDPSTGGIIGIVTTSTSIIATASDQQRNHLAAVQRAALVDDAFSALVLDRQLPLNG